LRDNTAKVKSHNVGGLACKLSAHSRACGWLAGQATHWRCSCRRFRASGYRRTSVAISARSICTQTPRFRIRVESDACRASPPAPDTQPLAQIHEKKLSNAPC